MSNSSVAFEVSSAELFRLVKPRIESVFPVIRTFESRVEMYTFETDGCERSVLNHYPAEEGGYEGPDMVPTDLPVGISFFTIECKDRLFVLYGKNSRYRKIRVVCLSRVGKQFAFPEWRICRPEALQSRLDAMKIAAIHAE